MADTKRTGRPDSHHASGRPSIAARLRHPCSTYTSRRATLCKAQVTDYNAQRKGTPVKRGREVDVGPHLGYHDDEAPSEQ